MSAVDTILLLLNRRALVTGLDKSQYYHIQLDFGNGLLFSSEPTIYVRVKSDSRQSPNSVSKASFLPLARYRILVSILKNAQFGIDIDNFLAYVSCEVKFAYKRG